MRCAKVLDKPDTRDSSAAEAVFKSTPTAFTQSSTTASRVRASCVCETSCWYWPTPMDLGSILTSSEIGRATCRERVEHAAGAVSCNREILHLQLETTRELP